MVRNPSRASLSAPFVEALPPIPSLINDISLAAVEARRRFRVHFTMWEADRSGDVEGDVRIAAARVDRDDAPRSYSARICAHSDGDRGDLAKEAFSPPSPFSAANAAGAIARSTSSLSRRSVSAPLATSPSFRCTSLHTTPTGIRHRFLGIRQRFLSAVSGAQSRGFAWFATRLNPLTPCFVTGKNFLRMRPGAGNGLPISQRFNYPPPLQKIFRLNAALLRTRVGFAPVNSTICPSNESSLQCQKLTRALPPLPLRVGAGLNELGAFQ